MKIIVRTITAIVTGLAFSSIGAAFAVILIFNFGG